MGAETRRGLGRTRIDGPQDLSLVKIFKRKGKVFGRRRSARESFCTPRNEVTRGTLDGVFHHLEDTMVTSRAALCHNVFFLTAFRERASRCEALHPLDTAHETCSGANANTAKTLACDFMRFMSRACATRESGRTPTGRAVRCATELAVRLR